MDGFTLLTGLCYVTALVALALNLPATIRSWQTGILGQGGRRLDSIVAALLGNAVWFAYGWITGNHEPMWINAWGCFCQAIYLGTFFALCGANERRGALKRLAIAALYLALTVRVGLKRFENAADEQHRQELQKLLPPFQITRRGFTCTCASLVAGLMPSYVAHFMTETNDWPISAFGAMNGVMWATRAILMWNIYLATMNVVAALSSSMLVALVTKWHKPEPVPEHTSDERTPLLSAGNYSTTGNTRVSSGDTGNGSNDKSHDKKIEPSAHKGKEPVIHESHRLDLEAGGSGTSQATDGALNNTSPAPAAATVPSPSAED